MDEELRSVRVFLLKAKSLINQGKVNLIAGRDNKNQKFLNKHGLTIKDSYSIVTKLYTGNRIEGPTEEEQFEFPTGTIFIFLKREEIDGLDVEIYIKLKIPDGEDGLMILSFHESNGKY